MLITRSGRNLGPLVIVDKFLARFALSDDMIRISVSSNDDLFYVAAILNTKTGQSLIRRDRNGSVIDHPGPGQIASLQIPLLPDNLRNAAVTAFKLAHELREQARLTLDVLASQFLQSVNLLNWESRMKSEDQVRRFAVLRNSISDRIDSEPNSPCYSAFRAMINKCGYGRAIGEISQVMKPTGRYTTLYVDDEEFGVKLLSGRQIAQFRAIGLKIMSRSAWKNPEEYILKKGMVLLTSDGRAKENLADCAMVRSDRNGWTASGHVHRLTTNDGIHPGLLYLACSCMLVQRILKCLATGSVIDALSEPDVKSVPVPYPTSTSATRMGEEAVEAWDQFAKASELESSAVAKLEGEILA